MHFRFKPRRNPGSQSQHRSVNRTAVSCSENSVILHKVSGRTLSNAETADLVLLILRMHWLGGDFRSMLRVGEIYETLFDDLQDSHRLAQYLHYIAICYVGNGAPDLAKPALDRCGVIAATLDDISVLGFWSMVMAWWHTLFGEPGPDIMETIKDHGEKASDIGRQLNDDLLTSFAEYAIAISALFNGDTRSMRSRGERLLNLADEDGNLMARQSGLAVLAWLSIVNQDAEGALANAEEALRLSVTPNVRLTMESIRGSALALAERGPEAYDALHSVRSILLVRNFDITLAGIETYYGLSVFLVGEFARGVKLIEDHMEASSSKGYHPSVSGVSHATLGEIYLKVATSPDRPPLSVMLRNWWFLIRTLPVVKRKARRQFEAAAQIWRKYPAPSLLAWALCGLAEVAAASGKNQEAKAYCEEAIGFAESVDAFATLERAKATLERI